MRQRTAHERHVLHAGHMDIADETAAAVQMTRILLAAGLCANAGVFHHTGMHSAFGTSRLS